MSQIVRIGLRNSQQGRTTFALQQKAHPLKTLSLRQRLARWWPATTTRALTICSVFGTLLLASAYAAKEHTALFGLLQASGAGGLFGQGTAVAGDKTVGLSLAGQLDPADPTVRFKETGVGHLLFASSNSDGCKRLLFDNRTGLYYQAKDIDCHRPSDEVVEANEPEKPNRLTEVRKSFKR